MTGQKHPLHSLSRRKVAVVGSGISGLSCAWLLSRSCDVTLFETEGRIGGHSNTVDVPGPNGSVPVDTGFIVYNERNYPNLTAMFRHLGVATEGSNMSFAASLDDGAFEYSGSGLAGLLGQKSNAVNPRFWSMLKGIARFYREAPQCLATVDGETLTLGQYLESAGYDQSFVEDHILPMGAAIWSTTAGDIRAFPLTSFLRFFINHGLVLFKGRPGWRTVKGGSRSYVERLRADFAGRIVTECHIRSIERHENGARLADRNGRDYEFDEVVIATHADEALAMLADASPLEQTVLSKYRYTSNEAVLHTDTALMPNRRAVWASWNYIGGKGPHDQRPLCVTYWMNSLQKLGQAGPIFVTLNPSREIAPDKVIARFNYAHPLFDTAAVTMQKRLWELQAQRRTWFCGAYFGNGFHEDGLQAGLAVAEALGGVKRPWTVADESGRIMLPAQTPRTA